MFFILAECKDYVKLVMLLKRLKLAKIFKKSLERPDVKYGLITI